jgi:hypothetical protein
MLAIGCLEPNKSLKEPPFKGGSFNDKKEDNSPERKPDRNHWQNNGWFDGKTPFKKL